MKVRRWGWLTGVLLAMLLAGSAGPARSADPRVDALMGLFERQLFQRYRGAIFEPYVSMGDPALFRRALEWASLRVDPAYLAQRGNQGRAEPGALRGAYLYLDADPRTVASDREETYALTAWHETMHLIEMFHGDPDKDAAWNDRHTYYFEAMRRDVLDRLARLEAEARGGGLGEEELRTRWQQVRTAFLAGAGDGSPPPQDLPTFAQWSGCSVDFQGIEAAYRAGRGGERLQRMVSPEGLLSSLALDEVRVEAQARDPGATGTSYRVRAQFRIEANPGVAWKGPVQWAAVVVGPGGTAVLRPSGTWPDRAPGPASGDFAMTLPDSLPPGSYTARVTLTAQGLTDKRRVTFPHAVSAPAPSPAVQDLQVSLQAPVETAVGREVTVVSLVTGGVPPYRYEWTTSEGQALTKPSIRGRFGTPGARTVTLQVWDRGQHASTPCTASATVQVWPTLEARTEGPTEVEPGKEFLVTAEVRGGKPEIDCRWVTETGVSIAGTSVTGHAGELGAEPSRITLRVQDSLVPPQVVEVGHTVAVRVPREIQVRQLEITPGSVAPGGTARVTLSFVPAGFPDPSVQAEVSVWLEGSSGTGQGATRVGTVEVRTGEVCTLQADYPIGSEARAGPIEALARIRVGDVAREARASAQIARGTAVETATAADFVGQYVYYDTTRPASSYHALAFLAPDGSGQAREWVDGPLHACRFCGATTHPIRWSWRDGIFTLDWRVGPRCSGNGWFSGPVRGTTDAFVLKGQWAGGGAANVRFVRNR